MTYKPGYLKSLENGELQKKIIALRQHLEKCRLCSHMCEVNRIAGERGFCGAGVTLEVASSCVHMGEEPVLTGNTGVGNIFLGRCNLRCVFCQNPGGRHDREQQKFHDPGDKLKCFPHLFW